MAAPAQVIAEGEARPAVRPVKSIQWIDLRAERREPKRAAGELIAASARRERNDTVDHFEERTPRAKASGRGPRRAAIGNKSAGAELSQWPLWVGCARYFQHGPCLCMMTKASSISRRKPSASKSG